MTQQTLDNLAPSSPARPTSPRAKIIPFSEFNNAYPGAACHVIGRGVTEFQYEDLAYVDEPIFFINDAVCMEKFAKSPTFFFAHDAPLMTWLNGSIRSTAVLATNSDMFQKFPNIALRHAGPLVYYRWRERGKESLLQMTRAELAATGQLYHHSGTIHPLLHFAWYCGFKRVTLIGCDGIIRKNPLLPIQPPDAPGGYDPRLGNRSRSTPAPWQYATIRRAQDLLAKLFNFETIYRGTPRSTNW
jgi:hypothetical protein